MGVDNSLVEFGGKYCGELGYGSGWVVEIVGNMGDWGGWWVVNWDG